MSVVDVPSLFTVCRRLSLGNMVKNLKSKFLNYDIGTLTVGATLDLFAKNGMQDEVESLQKLVTDLKLAFDDPTCQNPTAASTKKLRNLLRHQGKPTEGTWDTMIRRLNEIPDTGK